MTMIENSAGPTTRSGFIQGVIDGLLARAAWDRNVRVAPKSLDYVIGELSAFSTQPLALFFGAMDLMTNLAPRADSPAAC